MFTTAAVEEAAVEDMAIVRLSRPRQERKETDLLWLFLVVASMVCDNTIPE
jgi:hypothetical protein